MKIFPFKLDTGDRNAGTAYLPDTATGPLPVVIYCHGWGGSQKLTPPHSGSLDAARVAPGSVGRLRFLRLR